MEAPEKIYLLKIPINGEIDEKWLSDMSCSDDVEYIRKDAFIKKVDEFISTFFHPDDTELIDAVLNRFHKHMKGE